MSRSLAWETNANLAKLQDRAAAFGWRCVTKEWMGCHATYQFECAHGHRQQRVATYLLYGKGLKVRCTECAAEELKQRWLARVADRGGMLIGAFTRLNERHRLRCAKGHEWETLANAITKGHWCHRCAIEKSAAKAAASKRLTIEEMHEIAAARGGRCLSTQYVNNSTPLEWECARGHRWSAVASNVKQLGSWCKACAVDGTRLRLADIQRAVEKKGGRCLSTEYMNLDTPLLFECAAGHRWETAYRYIQSGKWCLQCYRERSRDGIEKMRAIAASRGGECLSDVYQNQMQPLRWRCSQGHEWEATGHGAKKHWCMRCFRERRRLGIEKMREVAAKRGGRCLSEFYVSTQHPLEWECHLGHRWITQPQGVLRGTWCPSCANLARSKKYAKRQKWDVEG